MALITDALSRITVGFGFYERYSSFVMVRCISSAS